MLSFDDFDAKQLIVITAQEYKYLSLRAGNLLIKDKDNHVVHQFSCAKIFSLWIIGDVSITTKILNYLLKYGICIQLLNVFLTPKCLIGSPLQGNVILRRKQYLSGSNAVAVAKKIIANKIENHIILLKKIRKKSDCLKASIAQCKNLHASVLNSDNNNSIRWYEWNAAKVFFQWYFKQIWRYRRQPRTKVDVINVLMDVWYSLLSRFIEAHLNLYGFDIYQWVFHTLFYQRKSLVCDIMEPFRCIIDHTIRVNYNLKKIQEKDFVFQDGEYKLSWKNNMKYMQIFLKALIEHKEEIFRYVKAYYRAVMNSTKEYPVFIFRE